jgi:peroxiredoxin
MRSFKQIAKPALILTGLALAALSALPARATGTVGEAAPAFSLKGLDGKTHALADYRGKVVVLEWLNPDCPFSNRHAEEKTMTTLAAKYGEVVWLGIDSSSPTSNDYLKPAAMHEWTEKNGIHYAVLYDDSGSVGHAYGAKTTPHMFIVGKDGKIAYNGAIDDDPGGRKAKTARVNFVDSGLSAERSGRTPDPAATKPYGCSVKY